MGYELNTAGEAFTVGLTSIALDLIVTSLFIPIVDLDSSNFSFFSRSCCFSSINFSFHSWVLCSRSWAVLRSATKVDTSSSSSFTIALALLIFSSNKAMSTNIIVNELRGHQGGEG